MWQHTTNTKKNKKKNVLGQFPEDSHQMQLKQNLPRALGIVSFVTQRFI